jgi:hypothetical protein
VAECADLQSAHFKADTAGHHEALRELLHANLNLPTVTAARKVNSDSRVALYHQHDHPLQSTNSNSAFEVVGRVHVEPDTGWRPRHHFWYSEQANSQFGLLRSDPDSHPGWYDGDVP